MSEQVVVMQSHAVPCRDCSPMQSQSEAQASASKRVRVASQTSDVIEIDVAKIGFIVGGAVDIDRIYRAILEVLDDEAIGGQVILRERGTDTIAVARWQSNLEAIIHIKRGASLKD